MKFCFNCKKYKEQVIVIGSADCAFVGIPFKLKGRSICKKCYNDLRGSDE